MTDHGTGHNSDSDAQLQRRFAALRETEAAMAPPIPDGSAAPLIMNSGWAAFAGASALPRLAAGFAVIALGVGLLVQTQPAEDPATLYNQTMAGQLIETDALLLVSEGVLPAMHDVPGLFEIDFDYKHDTLIN
ncbi:MAG: hypothetical protein HKN19_07310 [Halioglobus sp.]|nr:hypothetical protein [Halioglobus sp.]